MKRLTMLTAIAAVGCTVTVRPLPPTHPVKHGTKHRNGTSSSVPSKSQTIIKTTSSNVKETWWIENYHKLEAAHGNYTIRADDDITPLPNGKFAVPDTVLTHYQDLLMVTPTPKP